MAKKKAISKKQIRDLETKAKKTEAYAELDQAVKMVTNAVKAVKKADIITYKQIESAMVSLWKVAVALRMQGDPE